MTTQDPSADRRDDSAEFEQLNDQLSASIDRCRSLLDDCRSKLAANSNPADPDPTAANDADSPDLS